MVKKAMDAQRVAQERARILSHAQSLVEQDGFKDLSMRKLAAKLGITATTIYRYFASKDELYLSLLVVGFTLLRERMAACAAERAEPDSRLRAVIEEYIRFGMEQGGYYSIMFASDYPECRTYWDEREEAMAQEATRVSMEVLGIFRDVLMQCGEVDAPEERIAVAWATMHGFVALQRCGSIGNIVEDQEAVHERCVRTVLALVRPGR